MGGLVGTMPDQPVRWRDLEHRAYETMSPEAHGYVAGGAGAEDTVRANRDAFDRWRIVPRMLRDIEQRSLSTELAGTRMPAPVLLSPIGVQSIVHDEGELAVARAAGALGVPMVLSTASSFTLEQVAEANGEGPRWFQLYWPRDPELAESFLHRAEASGYSAIVVTLDTWLLAWRPRDLQRAYLPFLKATGVANYFADPVFRSSLSQPPEDDPSGAVLRFIQVFSDPTVTWDNLGFLRERTGLPIFLKGILHPDDARRAADLGMDGVIVSNHGGRQVDGAIAALDALPAIVEAVGARIPVLMDSGIRSGADGFKALALGARAVLLGRPYVWGLAVGGENGVRTVLRSFLAELDLTLALSGYRSIEEVTSEALVRA
ncbi:MAG TPA: lactate 2-monooxygenase [Actinomycetota bacterium]|jgi:isopentenyl diphosphate isomerase/L-lactate dehydrogenase-like FMN-dependent dehydrogenase